MKSRTLIVLFMCISACICLSSCVSEKPPSSNNKNMIFPKLKDTKLSLQVVSKARTFKPGSDNAMLVFRLKNHGSYIRVMDWQDSESDNLRIYYRPYSSRIKRFIASEWSCFDSSKTSSSKRHALLDLNKGNSVLIYKDLPFVKNAEIPKGKYYIIGELTADSIDARSKPIVITVE